MKTSVVARAMAATIVVGLTLVMAWIALRSASRFGWLLDAIAFTPIAIPSVIVGAGILFTYLMLPIPVYNTIWILLIAYVTLYLPYGMRFASSGITQIHRELEEVAEVAGARLGQVFLRILLPLLVPVLLAGWIYVFVLSVRELGASIFLVGPGTHVLGTISLTMWEEGGSYGAVSALGVIQILPLLPHRRRLALAGTARAAPQRGRRPRRQERNRDRPMFTIENLCKVFPTSGAEVRAVDGISLGDRDRAHAHAARAIRLRQDHDAALPRRPRAAAIPAASSSATPWCSIRPSASSCRRATAASAWCSSPTPSGRT